jgi:chaperonin GroES
LEKIKVRASKWQSFWANPAISTEKMSVFGRGTTFAEGTPVCFYTLILNFSTNMSKVSFKPLADRVLVEPAPAEEKTASGIIIPDTAKEKPQRGEIVAVGTGKKDEPLNVKVGDKVLYGKYSGTEITIDGTDYLIMKESDIYGVI